MKAAAAAVKWGQEWQQELLNWAAGGSRLLGVRAPGQRESPVRWRGSEDLPAPPQLRLLEQ